VAAGPAGPDTAGTTPPVGRPVSVAPGTVAAIAAVGSRATISIRLMRAAHVPATAFATLSPAALTRGLAAVGGAGTSRLRVRTAGQVGGPVSVSSPGTLVVPIGWAAGWRARVDGHRVPVRRAFGALLAVRLPAGDHTVELTYRVPGATSGMLVSALGLLALSVLGATDWRRRSHAESSDSQQWPWGNGRSVDQPGAEALGCFPGAMADQE
jgi:hypothetical protein